MKGIEFFGRTVKSIADNTQLKRRSPEPELRGTDHVNEQPHEYWIEKFKARGFRYDKILSESLSAIWKEKEVSSWYHKNIMVFLKDKV